jgi:hypothetical protein
LTSGRPERRRLGPVPVSQPLASTSLTDVRPITSLRAIFEWLTRSPLSRGTSSAFSDAVLGRPCGRPFLRAQAIRPTRTYSHKVFRSNPAKSAGIPAIVRRVGEIMSSVLVRGGSFGCLTPHSRRFGEPLDRVAQGVPGVTQPVLHGDQLPEP